MKTITLRALHAQTGRIVRAAGIAPVAITDRGRPVAVLHPWKPGEATQSRLPDREKRIARMPRILVDSASVIRDDREGR